MTRQTPTSSPQMAAEGIFFSSNYLNPPPPFLSLMSCFNVDCRMKVDLRFCFFFLPIGNSFYGDFISFFSSHLTLVTNASTPFASTKLAFSPATARESWPQPNMVTLDVIGTAADQLLAASGCREGGIVRWRSQLRARVWRLAGRGGSGAGALKLKLSIIPGPLAKRPLQIHSLCTAENPGLLDAAPRYVQLLKGKKTLYCQHIRPLCITENAGLLLVLHIMLIT